MATRGGYSAQHHKSLQNFFIRPTLGVGSKGAFSIKRRMILQSREAQQLQQQQQQQSHSSPVSIASVPASTGGVPYEPKQIRRNQYGFLDFTEIPHDSASQNNQQRTSADPIRGSTSSGQRQFIVHNLNSLPMSPQSLMTKQLLPSRQAATQSIGQNLTYETKNHQQNSSSTNSKHVISNSRPSSKIIKFLQIQQIRDGTVNEQREQYGFSVQKLSSRVTLNSENRLQQQSPQSMQQHSRTQEKNRQPSIDLGNEKQNDLSEIHSQKAKDQDDSMNDLQELETSGFEIFAQQVANGGSTTTQKGKGQPVLADKREEQTSYPTTAATRQFIIKTTEKKLTGAVTDSADFYETASSDFFKQKGQTAITSSIHSLRQTLTNFDSQNHNNTSSNYNNNNNNHSNTNFNNTGGNYFQQQKFQSRNGFTKSSSTIKENFAPLSFSQTENTQPNSQITTQYHQKNRPTTTTITATSVQPGIRQTSNGSLAPHLRDSTNPTFYELFNGGRAGSNPPLPLNKTSSQPILNNNFSRFDSGKVYSQTKQLEEAKHKLLKTIHQKFQPSNNFVPSNAMFSLMGVQGVAMKSEQKVFQGPPKTAMPRQSRQSARPNPNQQNPSLLVSSIIQQQLVENLSERFEPQNK